MRSTDPARVLLGAAGFATWLFLLSGCGSPPARFYVLSSVGSQGDGASASRAGARDETIVAIASVELPKHLDRPQIVTRSSDNRLSLGEFDRWAEPLTEDFSRVLIENLETLLADQRVLVTSWRGGLKADYLVWLQATRFDVDAAGRASLHVAWGLVDAKDELVAARRSEFEEVSEGEAYAEYPDKVKAMSGTVAALSREVAAAIRSALTAAR